MSIQAGIIIFCFLGMILGVIHLYRVMDKLYKKEMKKELKKSK